MVLLRDHADAILRATARDMATYQTELEQADKSKGDGAEGRVSAKLDGASKDHALGRVRSGFRLMELVAEYRALRASVIHLWGKSGAQTDPLAMLELTRFNECIDQSLAEAVRHFSAEMDRSREVFLGILGHDLRNPLNAILLSAESLGEISTGESATLASQIGTSANAMASMLADFIDFTASRLGTGIPLVIAPMDLGSLCRIVVDECSAGFPESHLRLEVRGDLRGEWDGARLRQLLSNLIGNAIQHGAEHSPIKIMATGDAHDAVLQFQNTGEPIPPELLPGIFDPLSRAREGGRKQRRHGSMGLGLYIAREVVAAHGGAIQVQSSASLGTEFKVTLPRNRRAPAVLREIHVDPTRG